MEIYVTTDLTKEMFGKRSDINQQLVVTSKLFIVCIAECRLRKGKML